jgi:hypothetical protein
MVPAARQDRLLVEEVGEELVVYDQQRQQAHRLNQTAAAVWRHCDGRRTVADLAAVLRRQVNAVADEDMVCVALDRLEAAHLLRGPLQRSAAEARLSRRQMVRKVGLLGALTALMPLVVTLTVPTPAQAQSAPVQPPFQCC